jgi:L-ascorbate metabolism protein UlaG (beta-lactamase superfamily)
MTTSSDSSLAARIAERDVPSGHLLAWWLGGSGFVFKSSAGTQVWIDPYLSDSVKGIFGIGRGFPPPINPTEVRPDAVISTHWHEDHLDPGTIPAIATHSPATRFIMPPSAMSRALGWGVARDRIIPLVDGQSAEIGDITITHMPARHEAGIPGWEVPDAMGVVLEDAGLRVYHTGDTEYDSRLRQLKSQHFDVMLVCINGTGGNMDASEAALLAYQLGVQTIIPMHHYLWEEGGFGQGATLDPAVFADVYRRLGGNGHVVIPKLAEEIDLAKGLLKLM